MEGIRRLRDNLSKVSLVSLFSGLGGAELLMQNIFAGVRVVADDLGLERPLQPRNLPLIFLFVFPFCATDSLLKQKTTVSDSQFYMIRSFCMHEQPKQKVLLP